MGYWGCGSNAASLKEEGSLGDAIRDLDEDPANTNNVPAIYSRDSIAKTNLGSSAGTWNREHRWSDSYGLEGTPCRVKDLELTRQEGLA
jgi:hypothetical protein